MPCSHERQVDYKPAFSNTKGRSWNNGEIGLEIGDGFIKMRAFARIGVLVNQLKKLLDSILQAKISNPDLNVSESPVVETMIKLVSTDGI